MTDDVTAPAASDQTVAGPDPVGQPDPTVPDPAAADPPVATPGAKAAKREWAMPKNPVTRDHVDRAGRLALRAGAAVGRLLAAVARCCGRVLQSIVRGIESIPAPVRAIAMATILMLLGIVGALAGGAALAMLCIVVVIPVCAITLGALGQHWFGTTGSADSPRERRETPDESELQRSVEYIDKKLTLALSAFSADRSQSAMIALFQAKTAIELTLGTEQSAATPIEAMLAVEDHTARPRIRAGAKSAMRESNSLAAS